MPASPGGDRGAIGLRQGVACAAGGGRWYRGYCGETGEGSRTEFWLALGHARRGPAPTRNGPPTEGKGGRSAAPPGPGRPVSRSDSGWQILWPRAWLDQPRNLPRRTAELVPRSLVPARDHLRLTGLDPVPVARARPFGVAPGEMMVRGRCVGCAETAGPEDAPSAAPQAALNEEVWETYNRSTVAGRPACGDAGRQARPSQRRVWRSSRVQGHLPSETESQAHKETSRNSG